jgi:tryptophan-rich sensory protein
MNSNATTSRARNLFALLGWVLLCFAVAGVGSRFTTASLRDWYPGLRKPALTPPGWIFGPVWSALYVMMAVAAWLVWRRRDRRGARSALGIFVFQLAVNAAWSPLFFGLRSPLAGMLDIAVLWCAIVAAAVAFSKIDRLAAWLLAPYLAWINFAGYLNVAIWRLNA